MEVEDEDKNERSASVDKHKGRAGARGHACTDRTRAAMARVARPCTCVLVHDRGVRFSTAVPVPVVLAPEGTRVNHGAEKMGQEVSSLQEASPDGSPLS